MDRFIDLMREMNCKNIPWAVEIAKMAIKKGDNPDEVAEQIRRNAPSLFYKRGKK